MDAVKVINRTHSGLVAVQLRSVSISVISIYLSDDVELMQRCRCGGKTDPRLGHVRAATGVEYHCCAQTDNWLPASASFGGSESDRFSVLICDGGSDKTKRSNDRATAST